MWLITGSRGVLGKAVHHLLTDAKAPSHSELDITNPKAVNNYLEQNAIKGILHCAAMTSVRECEERKEEAYRVNVQGTRNLCLALKKTTQQPFFIFISTACVFPGDNPEAFYSEEDFPYPKNFYALTKLLGECVVREEMLIDQFLIVRTNFAERGKWKYPAAFTDRFGTYLYPDQLATALYDLAERRVNGLVHIAGDTKMSMFEFARLSDPAVAATSLKTYAGPSLTINMCLTSKYIDPVPFRVLKNT